MKAYPEQYPQEYKDGVIHFFYQPFFVNEYVLIPRYETESLVRHCIQLCRQESITHIVDIGTGSGIIPLSLAHNLDLDFIGASDVSPGALKIAQKNATNLKQDVYFLEGNLFTPWWETVSKFKTNTLLVIANLPYIAQNEKNFMSPDTAFEPDLALFGSDEDGFGLYRDLLDQIESGLGDLESGLQIVLVIEFGIHQKQFAQKECEQRGWDCFVFSDERGIERFAEIWIVSTHPRVG